MNKKPQVIKRKLFVAYITAMVLMVMSMVFSPSIFAEVNSLSDRGRIFLLNLTRETLYWYLEDKSIPTIEDEYLTPELLQKKAVFITLKDKNDNLRGCMGMFEPVSLPLYKNVIDRAIASLNEDPRFIYNRISYDELEAIKIEISILSKPRALEFSSTDDLLLKLKPNIHGVIMRTPYGSSTYLPQVWKQLPKKETFLSELCKKQGAPSDCWRMNSDKLNVETYEVEHFGEVEPGGKFVGNKNKFVGRSGGLVLGHVLPLEDGLEYGAYPVEEGQELKAGTIVGNQTILRNKGARN